MSTTETSTTTTEPSSSSPSSWPTPAAPTTKIASVGRKKQKSQKDLAIALGFDSAKEHTNASWGTSHLRKADGKLMTPSEQYAEFLRIQAATRRLGSKVEKRYKPTAMVTNPPKPEDVTLELLMASQTHLGHNTSIWNPSNARYIYGTRQGVHIISLETTAAHLRRAARVVEEVAYRGGLILFVGTRSGQMEIVTKAAELAGGCHVFTKWVPGGITNRDILLRNASIKVVDKLDREQPGFEQYKADARPLVPDLVVCLNPLENYTLLYECGLSNIPTIGVIDTNTDPSWVTYTIPANDDSLRSVGLIAGVLGNAGKAGQGRRLAQAAGRKGDASWSTPADLQRHMRDANIRAALQRKEVMGRMQSNVEGFTEEEQRLLNLHGTEEEQSISDEDMINMMGASVEGGVSHGDKIAEVESHLANGSTVAKEVEAALSGVSHNHKISEVESHLARGASVAKEVEAALKGV